MKTQTDSEKKRYVPPMLKREAHLREITLSGASGSGSVQDSSEKGDSGRGSGDSKDFFDNDIFDN